MCALKFPSHGLPAVLAWDKTQGDDEAHFLVGQLVPGIVARPGASCTVAGGTKGLLHAPVSARQDVGVCAHGAANQHRLPSQLIVHGYEGMVGREGPGKQNGLVSHNTQRVHTIFSAQLGNTNRLVNSCILGPSLSSGFS